MVCSIIANDEGCEVLCYNGRIYTVTKQSSEVMMWLCSENAVSFNASRLACAKLLDIRQKPPVCISLMDACIYFPTEGVESKTCSWINYRYIESLKTVGKHKTQIVFRRGLRRIVDVDRRVLVKQMKRCEKLLSRKIDYEKLETY